MPSRLVVGALLVDDLTAPTRVLAARRTGPAELAGQRILRSAVAVLAGVATVVFALLLERACRVRDDRE